LNKAIEIKLYNFENIKHVSMQKAFISALFFLFIYVTSSAQIASSRLISRYKTIYTSSGKSTVLNDNKYGLSKSWTVTNNSWVALKIGDGHSEVFFSWNNPNYSWSDEIAKANSCEQSVQTPVQYVLEKSSNTTNGSNGDWTEVIAINNNNVTARGHLIDASNASWLRMKIINGGGQIDEIEVFDTFGNSEDRWFFVGTSITANTYKATPPSASFADLITLGHGQHDPAMIKGGIPCILSTNFKTDINKYLEAASDTKYWAIEMGTNDAWGGSSGNAATFKSNLQTVITACKNAGIIPIIARVLSTNETAAGWQVNQAFLTAVDELTASNELIEGPDLYSWFLEHPEHLAADGVHPNAKGAAQIQKLWAEKMASIYGEADSTVREPEIEEVLNITNIDKIDFFEIYPNPLIHEHLDIHIDQSLINGHLKIMDTSGKTILNYGLVSNTTESISFELPSGVYLIELQKNQASVIRRLIIN